MKGDFALPSTPLHNLALLERGLRPARRYNGRLVEVAPKEPQVRFWEITKCH